MAVPDATILFAIVTIWKPTLNFRFVEHRVGVCLIIFVKQCKVKALQGFDACALDCLNNWYCIDACYKEDIQKGFSKCKCFDEIPNVDGEDEDDRNHLTLIADLHDQVGYV